MGIFSQKNAAAATPFGSGRYFVPGTYIVQVKKLESKPSKHPKKKDKVWFIAEHEIIEFTGVKYQSVEAGKGVIDTTTQFKTGDTVTHTFDIEDEGYGASNMLEYMAAIKQAFDNQRLGQNISIQEAQKTITNPEGDSLFEGEKSKEVPGLLLKVECWPDTKAAGTEDFTGKRFSAYGTKA